MHEPLQRASNNRRRSRAIRATVAAAVFLCGSLNTGLAGVPNDLELSAVPESQAASLPRSGLVRDIAIETVAAGQEGLELSARLTEDAGLIQRPIGWTIADNSGQTVFSGESPTANASLFPGDYTVAIRYGAVNVSQTLTLVQGTRLSVSFVLDAGGLRILPRLQGSAQPATVSKSFVYALSGQHPGEMIATSELPGEIIRLPAGDYRVESRYAIGNAYAVTDVRVKPGLMSAIEIDHKAGLAHLSFIGAPDTPVRWKIVDASGIALPPFEGLTADAVLKPGSYTAIANTGSETLTAQFEIAAGQTRDINLGN